MRSELLGLSTAGEHWSTVVHQEFSSFGEFFAAARDAEQVCNCSNRCAKTIRMREDTIRSAENGSTRGLDEIEKIGMPMFDDLAQLIDRPEVNFDVTGAGFDTGRVLSGEPESWVAFAPHVVEGMSRQYVQIVVNGGAHGDVSAAHFRARGAAVVALVQLLEYSGRGVEVIYNAFSRAPGSLRSDTAHSTRFPVKAADQPIDLPKLMFVLGDEGVFRECVFRLRKSTEYDAAVFGCKGMGGAAEVPEPLRGDIYIPRDEHGANLPPWTDPAATRDWLRSTLLAQGVKFRE